MDLEAGPGVDVVLEDVYHLPFADGSVDVVLTGQMLEHCAHFWKVFNGIARVLKPEGLAIVIAPSSGPVHRYPVDCYRFYPDSYQALADWSGLRLVQAWTDERGPWCDLIGIFQKGGDLAPVSAPRPLAMAMNERQDRHPDPAVEKVRGARPYLDVLRARQPGHRVLPLHQRRLLLRARRAGNRLGRPRLHRRDASRRIRHAQGRIVGLRIDGAVQRRQGLPARSPAQGAFDPAPALPRRTSGARARQDPTRYTAHPLQGPSHCQEPPFDLALYQSVLGNLRPATIIEVGTSEGGSAVWLADQCKALGLDATGLTSIDISPPELTMPGIRFFQGDATRPEATFPVEEIAAAPHPWLVIEDSAHTCESTVSDRNSPHFQARADW
ncbi:MAG: class I SAM-dependent methyltransferase [Sphingomonadales bacterium]|nr:class I SAM-dependent methyltransferase [Sphingomonadales bacterium]MDE2568427.1 class I SAM-dependent methyltransferase [Sphingomonadales bacterium]